MNNNNENYDDMKGHDQGDDYQYPKERRHSRCNTHTLEDISKHTRNFRCVVYTILGIFGILTMFWGMIVVVEQLINTGDE